VLPLAPTPGFLHVDSLRSWYGDADSFGGVKVGEAVPTHIDAAECAALASRFEALRLGGASRSPSSIARLKMIDAMAPSFALEAPDGPAARP
jgi:hypothetical protein